MANQPTSALTDFLQHEATGGVVLVCAAVAALALANSPAAPMYERILHLPVAITAGKVGLHKSLLHWVNDGAMAVFFLLVGLEIKRELVAGELSGIRKATVPAIAALGGMAVPAAIFAAVNWGDATALRGWAIPTATDIAFATGVFALLGRRAPPQLRAFLLALAITDDIGAVLIIALFYTAQLSAAALALGAVFLLVLVVFNLIGVVRLDAYVLVGIALWACVLESGVHATLSGVVMAFAIPFRGGGRPSPLEKLEHALQPYVTWGVLPLFAFANAGVDMRGLPPGILTAGLPLGIALGLFVGKQAGILLATWLSVRAGIGELPDRVSWRQFHGIAALCGIGFTISLFIGGLAFSDRVLVAETRLGILLGSIVSACVGFALLRIPARSAQASAD